MAIGGDIGGGQCITLGQAGQTLLGVVGHIATIGGGGGFHIGTQETGEGQGAARCGELGLLPRGGRTGNGHLHGGALGIRHLGGDGALPDQLIELKLLRIELTMQLTGGGEGFTGGADRLVGLLGVLHLAVIGARGG